MVGGRAGRDSGGDGTFDTFHRARVWRARLPAAAPFFCAAPLLFCLLWVYACLSVDAALCLSLPAYLYLPYLPIPSSSLYPVPPLLPILSGEGCLYVVLSTCPAMSALYTW